MRRIKYSTIVIFITVLHLYFYQNPFIHLADSKISDFFTLYFGEQHSISNSYYIPMNLTFSYILSLGTLYLLYKRSYIYLFTLFLLSFVLSSSWFLLSLNHHTYVHIIYLGLPYTLSFVLLSLMAVITNAQEKKIQEKALEESQESALESMMSIINIHDKETGEHIIRTKEYTKALAKHLLKHKIYPDTITPTFIECLYKAAPLHDIGKIGIPDVILKKPGKLTRTEFEVMKDHALLGKEIVKNFITQQDKNNFFTLLHDVVYSHHERWDGKGYPCNLKENEIPLSAQIMALCDVYDALVSKRRYKDSFPYEKADSIIIESKGTAFNPILVDAFLAVRMEFHNIADTWKDKEEKVSPIEIRDTIKSLRYSPAS